MITLSELERCYGIENRRAKRLIDAGKLILIKEGGNGYPTYVSRESVNCFLEEQEHFLKNHIYYRDFFDNFPVIANYKIKKYINDYDKMNKDFNLEPDFMKVIELPENYYGIASQIYYFKKKDVEKLQKDYVNLIEAKEISGIAQSSNFTKWLNRRPNIQVFRFGSGRHQKFIRKDHLQYAIDYFEQKKLEMHSKNKKYEKVSKSQAMKLLSLSKTYFEEVINSGLLSPSSKPEDNTIFLYKKSDVLDLVDLQKEKYTELSKRYYSKADIEEKYPDLNIDSVNKAERIKKIPLPPLLTPFFRKGVEKWDFTGKWLYLKKDVDKYHSDTRIRNSIFNEANYSIPFDEYKRRLSILRISFPVGAKTTEKLWLDYVEEILRNSDGNQPYTTSNYITILARAAEGIVDNIEKEIFKYTSNQLNIKLLNNENIPRSSREYIFSYLVFIDKVISLKQGTKSSARTKQKAFKIDRLINPRKLPRSNLETKIYSYDEYQHLFNYTIDIDLHKQKAINDALDFIKGKKKASSYKKYDSVWLYVLLHLNNAWRHSDCIQIPRISLAGTEIKDLNWLLYNELNKDDVKKIIFRIKAADMSVSKTGETRNFFCSTEVEQAMATAIAICELRTRAINDLSDTIIYKINNQGTLAQGPKKAFFKSFDIKNFDFQNRAMNRTLLSLMAYIQSVSGNGHDSEYIKILRSHVEFETTNLYITIPQERLDQIALQLFDRDMFGHIPDVLAELIFGKQTEEEKQTENIKLVKQKFGDIYKIEETANFLNEIHSIKAQASQAFLTNNQEYKDIIESIIRDMSPEEANSLYNRIITGQLPSKQKHYQCIVSETNCKFPGRNCNECPLSIPHFYALSSLVERIFKKATIIYKELDEELPEAELTRLANWIALDLDLLKDAQRKYGKQEIAMFATGINQKLKLINSVRPYQTIGGEFN
jgi:hypothetical protein